MHREFSKSTRTATCGRIAFASMLTLCLFMAASRTAHAANTVLNDGFETEDTMLWLETGNVPFEHRGVARFDVKGAGLKSWAYYQHPGWDCEGGLEQTIHLLEGVAYEISADICYHSG
jgi:hypothetical protein